MDIVAMKAKIRKYKAKMREKEMAEGKTPQSIYAKTSSSYNSNLSDGMPKKKLKRDIGKIHIKTNLAKTNIVNPEMTELTQEMI